MFRYQSMLLPSKDIPDGMSHFQAKPVGDDEHSSSNPNRISDSMLELGFTRKVRNIWTDFLVKLNQNGSALHVNLESYCGSIFESIISRFLFFFFNMPSPCIFSIKFLIFDFTTLKYIRFL